MSSLKYAAIVVAGAGVAAFIAVAVVMPQVAGATAANVGKLILTQWLGLGTTTPSQRLSVAGSAYITGDVITGSGIKFSDGTTQTTAASGGGSGISGYEIVSYTKSGYSYSGSGGWSVSCSSGKKVLGGGCHGGDHNGYCISTYSGDSMGMYGYPSSQTTYTCNCMGGTSHNSIASNPTVYAICATTQ